MSNATFVWIDAYMRYIRPAYHILYSMEYPLLIISETRNEDTYEVGEEGLRHRIWANVVVETANGWKGKVSPTSWETTKLISTIVAQGERPTNQQWDTSIGAPLLAHEDGTYSMPDGIKVDATSGYWKLDKRHRNVVESSITTQIQNLQESAEKKLLSSRRMELTKEEKGAIHIQCYSLDWKYTFGKYSGLTISEVIDADQNYIWWCVMSLISFSVSNKVVSDYRIAKSTLFTKAVDINWEKGLYQNSWEGRWEAIAAHWDNIRDEEEYEAKKELYYEQMLDDMIRDEERSMDEETDGFWRWNID